jgi:hypothetical protein
VLHIMYFLVSYKHVYLEQSTNRLNVKNMEIDIQIYTIIIRMTAVL